MTIPRVIGLDLSTTSTGIAVSTPDGQIRTSTIRPKKKDGVGLARMDFILAKIRDWLTPCDLVVVEGPSYGSSGAGSHERAGLWWLVARDLARKDIPYAIAPPKCRAQYAAGTGDANKREVIAAVAAQCHWWDASKRPGLADEADALALCAMGLDHVGHPPFDPPERHRRALDGVQWPVVREGVAA